jgi:hypothetical protein
MESVRTVTGPDGFTVLHAAECEAAIWNRTLAPEIERWIALWLPRLPLSINTVVARAEIQPHMLEILLAGAGCPPGSALRAFADDVTRLALLFCPWTNASAVHLRLERLEDDGCRKFHTDALSMRLLCTYAGPGTEWVAAPYVNRAALGNPAPTMEEANRRIVPDPSRIQTLATGAVMLFKGATGDHDTGGLVHRSHPVRNPGERRLRLCINEPDSGY